MPLSVDQEGAGWRIRVEGEFSVACATELKSLLLEGLASTKELQVDLAGSEDIHITLLQLLFAAGRGAALQGKGMVSGVSEAAAMAARDAGFEHFPGSAVEARGPGIAE